MSNGRFCLLVALLTASTTVFAAKERIFRFQNSVRVGYDDNVYRSSVGEEGTVFITDIVNISAKLTFSSRSDMLLYWQPEFRYRLDADPKMVTYQDLYARFNHAISQRTFFRISDRFRYQEREAQSDLPGTSSNQNYIENDLTGGLDYSLNALSQINVDAGYEFREWDSSYYGKELSNNYDQFTASGYYIRELRRNRTQGLLGASYTDLSYDGSRGGYNSTAIFGGVDQNFNANIVGNIRLGYSFSTIDNSLGLSNDASSPYLQTGLEINPTARTSFTGSMGYSTSRSENSVYNAQDRFNFGLGVRHDLTGKISLSSSIHYTYGLYDSSYASKLVAFGAPGDAQDNYVTLDLRASYQINRNNFVDAGCQFSTRSSDSVWLSEYDRNQVDIGWRLRL